MKLLPWMKVFPTDLLAELADLNCAEVGAYMRLCLHAWDRGGVPDSPEKLARLAGGKVSAEVVGKLCRVEVDGVQLLSAPWIEASRTDARAVSDKQRKTAEARWNKDAAALPRQSRAYAAGMSLAMPPDADAHSGPDADAKKKEQEQEGASAPPAHQQASNAKPGAIGHSKPTLEEVTAYLANRRTTVDANAFFNFYESNGWRVGKAPMKNWHAAVVTWEKRDADNGKLPPAPMVVTPPPAPVDPSELATDEDVRAMLDKARRKLARMTDPTAPAQEEGELL